jgi:glycopeptide antibiotics resistance protein
MHRLESYVRLAIIFIVIISILYLPILFMLKNKGKKVLRQISYLLLFCSLFLILFATIFYTPISFEPEEYHINLQPFKWVEEMKLTNGNQVIAETIPNIIMFIPLGFLIPIVIKKARKWHKTTLIVLLITISIETFQYFIGRSSDIDDIITNLLGGMIGYAMFKGVNQLFRNKKWWGKCLGREEKRD